MAQHFYELFSTSVDQHANRIAIEVQRRDGLDQLTYAELREMAERTAAWLALIGLISLTVGLAWRQAGGVVIRP